MVVSETNTLFPLITTHAQIRALPQIVAPHQGQNDKYAHPPISAPIPHPPPISHLTFLNKFLGMQKETCLHCQYINQF